MGKGRYPVAIETGGGRMEGRKQGCRSPPLCFPKQHWFPSAASRQPPPATLVLSPAACWNQPSLPRAGDKARRGGGARGSAGFAAPG